MRILRRNRRESLFWRLENNCKFSAMRSVALRDFVCDAFSSRARVKV